jgi:hypothetical protein
MKITFLESGGFAGGLRGCRLDAAGLTPAERAAVEQLVAASGLDASGEWFAPGGRDRRQYDLAIEAAGRVVRISCDESCLPEPARPLVEFLAARAMPQGLDFELPAASDDAPAAAGFLPRADRSAMSGPDAAASRWGRFEGDVVARWENDGRLMTLLEPFAYVDPRQARWEAAAGAAIDGASIPRAFWSVIGSPFAGEFRNASVVHDVACEARNRPWRAVHRMFYEACRLGGVGAVKAKTMYYAVFHFGPRWHVEERTTLVAGTPHVERVVRDETPAPPTEAEVAAIVDYFVTHDVAAADIPTLTIPDSGD